MSRRGRARTAHFFVGLLAVVAVTLHPPRARAQQTGSDVGGQPARRKITKVPRLVRFVEAPYPEARRARGEQASVVLVIEIATTGQVAGVTVAEGAGSDWDAAAVEAARQFVFEPAEVDDRPAPAKITYRYDFVLREQPVPPPAPAPAPVPPPEPTPSPRPAEPAPAAPEQEVTVRSVPRAKREAIETRVRAEQARLVPGTQGDVLKVVQNLPGVSRPPLASGQIVVWGAAPKDTRVLVDGVEIPALYHGSGLRGTIGSDLVASIDLVPGAFSSEYGRGLGGLVRVTTRPLPRGRHLVVAADTLDGSALASAEIGERVRVAAGLRYGWLDRVLAATSARDVGDFFPVPRYADAQLKAVVDLRPGETLEPTVLVSTDALDRTVASADPAAKRVEATASRFYRLYARYTRRLGDGEAVEVVPFFGQDASRLAQRFGGNPSRLDVDTDRYGVRGSLRARVAKSLVLTTGLDALGSSARLEREGSLTLPAREGDVAVFGQPPGDDVAADTWSTHVLDVAPFVHADLALGPLTLSPGVRADAYLLEVSRSTPRVGGTPPIGSSRLETAVAPRASARLDVTPRLALTAAFGTYHQAPEPEDLSAVFGTPALALSRATHMTAGESLRITRGTTLEVTGFRKTMRDLVVRSRLENPLLARALTQSGEGRSFGVQFLLRQEMWRGFFGWVSYAISRSERRFEGDESWRPFDFDQAHVLSVVGSQEIGPFTVGARFRYASGNPRTPVVGSVYDARADRYDPVFGPQNTIRIPAFWQLDLRIERAFRLGPAARLLLYADVQNVTARENAEELVYSPSFRERGVIRGLPTLAVVGGRIEL